MTELREKIAEIIMDMPDYSTGDDQRWAGTLADRILAIPEIAEALKLVVIDPHPLQRDEASAFVEERQASIRKGARRSNHRFKLDR